MHLDVEKLLQADTVSIRDLREAGVSSKTLRLFACACAKRCLWIFEEKYPGDQRLRDALEESETASKNGAPFQKPAEAALASRAANKSLEICLYIIEKEKIGTSTASTNISTYSATYNAAMATHTTLTYSPVTAVGLASKHSIDAMLLRDKLRTKEQEVLAQREMLSILVGNQFQELYERCDRRSAVLNTKEKKKFHEKS